MPIINILLKSIPYLWILLNGYLLVAAYKLNGYKLFGGDQSHIRHRRFVGNVAHNAGTHRESSTGRAAHLDCRVGRLVAHHKLSGGDILTLRARCWGMINPESNSVR